MVELLTVLDDQGNEIGVEDREEVHKRGLWHRTFQCWFIELEAEDPYIYLQLRAASKRDFPGTLDITTAGHIEADEAIIAAGIREIEEELGIKLAENDLIYQGCYQEELMTEHMIDREFCHVYFHPVNKRPDFRITDEVEDVIRLRFREFEEILQGGKREGDYLLSGVQQPISLDHLCPHTSGYFSFVAEAVKKLTSF